MTRPDDIPEWAWEKAEAAIVTNKIWGTWVSPVEGCARAILAAVEEERAQCIAICEEQSDNFYYSDPHDGAYRAAAAIRNRSVTDKG